jgi:hypothetical protein
MRYHENKGFGDNNMIAETVLKRLLNSNLTGDKLVELLTGMEAMLNLSDAAQGSLVLGYVEDLKTIKVGDFIPTITLSLVRYTGAEENVHES